MEPVNPFDQYAHETEAFGEIDELLDQLFPLIDTPQAAPQAQCAGFLGDFLDARLANLGWSADQLAEKLGWHIDQVGALLTGALPTSELDDRFIVKLAEAIGYEANLLRIMLGQAILPEPVVLAGQDSPMVSSGQPQGESSMSYDQYQREIEKLLDQVNQVTEKLMQDIDERFPMGPAAEDDAQQQHKQYDFVRRQIEMVIAKQRADSKLVQILIDELKSAEVPHDSEEANPHRLDIRRIIHFIKETI